MIEKASGKGRVAVTVAYTLADTSVGRVLMAVTDKGICAISLGSDDDQLVAELRRDFAGAAIERDDAALQHLITALIGQIDGELPTRLPLDVRATAFQRLVWDELWAIPHGETRSYTQIAEQIGRPSAARAVASACGSNRIAVAIPCHRVVGSSGHLSGYRWGVERKRALLDMERSAK